MNNNKICVYAIAKNEAKFAEAWYNSMKEADLVIVLDTGSEDDTVNILCSLGATVYTKDYDHFRFDVARNDSLHLVPEEYNICVCTDLDERFEPGWADLLRKHWDDEKHLRALYPYVHDHLDDGSEGFIFTLDKIHSRKNSYWKFAVHEILFVDGYDETKALYFEDGVRLHHYPDLTKSRANYINLLRERIEEDPSDSLGILQYGMELQNHGMFREAIEAYEEIVYSKYSDFSPIEVAGSFCHLGECYEAIEDQKKAVANYLAGITEDPLYRESYYCLAKAFMFAGMYDMAIGIALQGLETSVRRYHWIEGVFTWAWGLYDILWRCYYQKGEYEKAFAYVALALQTEPGNPTLQESYSICLSMLTNN